MKVRQARWSPRTRRKPAFDVPRDEPQEDEMEVHEALLNWAAWCVERARQGRAMSAEGNYRPEKGNIWNPPEPGRKVDVPRAEAVNAAMTSVPDQHRLALHLRYYLGMPDRGICMSLSLQPVGYLKFMRDARLMLAGVLQRPGKSL